MVVGAASPSYKENSRETEVNSRRYKYLKFTLKVVGDVCVLKLEGKFTGGGDSFFLREKIKNVLSMGIQKILVDMEGVPYIDSTGVGFLVGSHTSITQEGGQLKLLRVKPKILEVLKVMNLLKVLEIFEDEDAALKSFAEKKPPSVSASPKKKRTSKVAKETE
jgi:anti-sigma B factor antagonist